MNVEPWHLAGLHSPYGRHSRSCLGDGHGYSKVGRWSSLGWVGHICNYRLQLQELRSPLTLYNQQRFLRFLFFHVSHATHEDHGDVHIVHSPPAARLIAARCTLSFALRHGLSPQDMKRTEVVAGKKRERKKSRPQSYSSAAGAAGGRWRKEGLRRMGDRR